MTPQRNSSPLFACAARHEAETASAALTSQSTSIGSEATLRRQHDPAEDGADDAAARRSAPSRAAVVKIIARNCGIDVGVAKPNSAA